MGEIPYAIPSTSKDCFCIRKATEQTKEGKMKPIRRHSGAFRVMMILLFGLLLASGTVFAATHEDPTVTIPWEEKGAKQPADYTFEEFNDLTQAQKDAFIAAFPSMDEFNKWADAAQSVTLPWEESGAKQPADYTFEEFNELSQAQKNAFIAAFPSADEFNKWADAAQSVTLPWEESGAKQPKDYTFEEFNALSQAQKDAFIDAFQSTEEFNKWADAAQTADLPWKQPGAKQPKDYTYEEFNQLSDNQKLQFIAEFESREEFEKWMDELQSDGNVADSETEKSEHSANLPWIMVLCAAVLAGIVFAVKKISGKSKEP